MWQAAATAELSAGDGADSQLKAADAWWEVAQTAGPSQVAVRLRALDWYVKAEPELSCPISRTRAANRKSEFAALLKIEISDCGLMNKSGGEGDEVAGGQEDRLVIDTANSFDWDDAPMTVGGHCACIEWGEE